jgi:Fe(3+) dicitrate transport protein
MFDWNLNRTFLKQKKTLSDCLNWLTIFKIRCSNIEGNKVEFVPLFNIKERGGYKNFMSSLQHVCLLTIYRS